MASSEDIRKFCVDNYVVPAAQANEAHFAIRIKEVHENLQLESRHPQIISALKAELFCTANDLVLTKIEGPKESSTTVLFFNFKEKFLNNRIEILTQSGSGKPKVFIANFGFQNNIWESCLNGNNVATMNDVDTQQYWKNGDKEGFIQCCLNSKTATSGKPVGRSTASRWYNLMTIISGSSGDIWLHRAKDILWWTETLPDDPIINLEVDPDPNPGFPNFYVCRKPCKPWRSTDESGRPLLWNSIHPKAKYFLHTEATLQQLRGENPNYVLELLKGNGLSEWHDQGEWQEVLRDSSKGMVGLLSAKELSIDSMIINAEEAARDSGKERRTIAKEKKVTFGDRKEFKNFIHKKIKEQEGLCALTNIPLEFKGTHTDENYLCSLDRIDSNGHYEPNNLQLVCRFINFWKSDRNNEMFQRQIELIKATP